MNLHNKKFNDANTNNKLIWLENGMRKISNASIINNF